MTTNTAMKRTATLTLALLLGGALAATGQDTRSAEEAAIVQVALDYIEGWYAGDAERMERALHPELAKRALLPVPGTESKHLEQTSALSLIHGTRGGYGKQTPPERRQKDITVLDVFENAASAKIVAADWIDYLHLVREDGRWKIVNVLWELKPQDE